MSETEKRSLVKRFAASTFKKAAYPYVSVSGSEGALILNRDGSMKYIEGFKNTKFHIDDVTAAAVEDGTDLQSRVTVTRLALTGIFAFALKKTTGGEKYLTVETSDRMFIVQVPRKAIESAHELVNAVRKHLAEK